MTDLGMPTLIENRTLQENIDLCRRLGLRFIEINMNFPEYGTDTLADIGPLMRAAEKAGVYYTLHLEETLDPACFSPLVREAYLETVRRTVLAAKALLPLRDAYAGTDSPLTVNMHMAHGIHITLPDKKVQMYERDRDVYLGHFGAFAEKVADWIGDAPVRVTVENTDGFRPYEQAAAELLLQKPCFGLTWDIGHSKAAGEKDVPFILSHRDKLCHMHVHDGTEEPPRNHLALGTGRIDLRARLQTAREVNARCVLETKTVRALETSVQWLKDNGLFC